MKAFITGCTGYVGRHLAKRLLREGHQICALVRKYSDVKTLENLGIEVCIGDVTKLNTLSGIPKDIDVVFHLAGIFLGSNYKEVVLDGITNMVNVFQNSTIKSFIFTSISPVYGNVTTELFSKEDMLCNPNFKEAKLKLEAEEVLLKAYREYKFPVVILRIPSIYGGIQSHFELIFINRIKSGKMYILGQGKNQNSYVQIYDAVQALMLATSNNNALGEIFNIAGGDKIAMKELCYFIALNVESRKPRHVPILIAHIISGIISMIAKLKRKESDFPRALIKILTMNGALDIEKSKKILRYDPIYKDTLEGIKRCYFS